MTKLTAIQIRKAKPQEKPYKLSDGQGLNFHVAVSGKKTWRYRFKLEKKESTCVLGEYPEMTLEQARKARAEAREKVKAGKNPAHERRQEKQAVIEQQKAERELTRNSFEAVAREWMQKQAERWSKGHAAAVRTTLERDAFPFFGDCQVDAITPPMVLEAVQRIEKRGALEIAHKVLQRIKAVFRYAVQTGKATYNPAADMQNVLKTRKKTHMAALSREEMPEFMRKLAQADIDITTKAALRFTILTAARSGETRGATWDEINLDTALWRIPAKRMKMDNPHNVPLSTQAVAIIEQMGRFHGKEGLVFPGRDGVKPLSENTMLYALYRMGYHSRATVHGFRAVFSTIANESGFDGDVIEKALAHEQRNKVRAAYHRSEYIEQRRELMQWWGDLLREMEQGG
ncbi:MAG: tyrosine-type recombinase/integrase [Candidatus Electrothrix scaldis]|nr:MAG: tyrosine-type recombinase/integrase [Candidatus Electrothrix sp. GW3-3]